MEGEGVGDRRERVTGLVRGLWRLLVGVEEGEEGADVDTDPTPVVLSERADDRLIEKCQAIVRCFDVNVRSFELVVDAEGGRSARRAKGEDDESRGDVEREVETCLCKSRFGAFEVIALERVRRRLDALLRSQSAPLLRTRPGQTHLEVPSSAIDSLVNHDSPSEQADTDPDAESPQECAKEPRPRAVVCLPHGISSLTRHGGREGGEGRRTGGRGCRPGCWDRVVVSVGRRGLRVGVVGRWRGRVRMVFLAEDEWTHELRGEKSSPLRLSFLLYAELREDPS